MGASTIGRVAQRIDLDRGIMESYFDTILFALTVIPIFGWFKLLPTFGGRVVSFADGVALDPDTGKMDLVLDRTRVELTEGIPKPPLVLPWFLDRDYPVRTVWKLLPWNKGRSFPRRRTCGTWTRTFASWRIATGNISCTVECGGGVRYGRAEEA